MRIIGGTHKGRQLHPPKNLPVRPTTDFAKEALFNILHNRLDFESLRVLDLFCGTGNVSFEFASRGSASVLSVDQNARCIQYVRETAREINLPQISTLKADCFQYLKTAKGTYDLIFSDPPYDHPRLPELPHLVLESGLLAEGGLFILEHGSHTKLPDTAHLKETRKYGNSIFSIFER